MNITGLSGLINRSIKLTYKKVSGFLCLPASDEFPDGVGSYPDVILNFSNGDYTAQFYDDYKNRFKGEGLLYGNVDWNNGKVILSWMGLSGRYFGELTIGLQIYYAGRILAQGPIGFSYEGASRTIAGTNLRMNRVGLL